MPAYDAINKNIGQILEYIKPVHVTEYDWLVRNIQHVAEADYQERYKTFWRLNGAGLSQSYCKEYFQYLQEGLTNDVPKLGDLVTRLYKVPVRPNKYALQFSFCTKICHMLNRELPIYDSTITDFYSFRPLAPGRPVNERIDHLVKFHERLDKEYNRVLHNGLLSPSIEAFRKKLDPQYFTDIKIIDSLIWAYSQRGKQ